MYSDEIEVGEIAQALNILEDAIEVHDEDGAKQVYSMILYHIAHKHNPRLVESLDKMMSEL
jgi:predicted MPP superfamily phosphohydrolase